MSTETDQVRNAQPRSEKISALTALLGPDAMERLRQRHPDFAAASDPIGSADAERVAWQRTRLLQRLRSNWDGPLPEDKRRPLPPEDRAGVPARGRTARADRIDTFIASGLSMSALKDEHPAVIARVLRGLDRAARVSLLQELPGHTARSALRRMKSP